ncbi:stachyose synthase [Iris pallida]|uniref:galactinol--sucrose galactosyltransferase n=1 Tax=Iris pallida TaxID=29817 RepID=A0AAX6HXU4_IRIPA|nr:stachyose synthase [Iris pallida]
MAPNLIKASTDALSGADVDVLGTSTFTLKGGKLTVNGHSLLTDVPSNIILTPSSVLLKGKDVVDTGGCFIGFEADEPLSRHVVPLGRLEGIRFMSIFRFKVWWTTLWVGTNGSDVENETQMVLLDRSERSGTPPGPNGSRPYVLLLPILEGPFRASLQSGEEEEENVVDLCVESGSNATTGSLFTSTLYVRAGDDPYALVRDATSVVRAHLGTFRTMEEKTPPGVADKFGWCTWDAFYLKVHPEGVREGVRRLAEGGCPPGMVLIDDGWQSICGDGEEVGEEDGMNHTSAGEQMPCRLTKFEENNKFRRYQNKSSRRSGLGAFVRDLKDEFGTVEYVYVWHALCGYWGGLRPRAPGLPEARVVAPKLSPGLERTMEDLAVDKIVDNGVGLVLPERAGEMYDGLHSHLQSAGIDGVKVDVIHVLEMLGEEYGGRVELAKAYYRGLTESVQKHFNGNGVIASMEHCNDFMLLGTEAIALGRVGDDFWCTDPNGDPAGTFWLQGCHMVHCAYNSLWMGNFIRPDWDMFQSTHPCAPFHAASRAISGGPVYVSDSVGEHDFELLRRLALPDGTILRCEHYALPTRDCLFEDPLHDGKTMLKIWNLNKFTGVLGVFNCQGGGWCPRERRNKCYSEHSRSLWTKAKPADIEWQSGRKPIPVEKTSLFAVYLCREGRLIGPLEPEEDVEVALGPFDYELLVVSPVSALSSKGLVRFAPVGLANMLNCGGAVESLELRDEPGEQMVRMSVKGGGELKAFSSVKPAACRVGGAEVSFVYEEGMVGIEVPWSGSSSEPTVVEYLY